MKRTLTLSWRVGVAHYETDEIFSRLFTALTTPKPSIIDEIAFAESMTHHVYQPMETYERRAAIMKRRMEAFRAVGVRAGINVGITLGHINEAWTFMKAMPFQPMIDTNGVASTGCACPNSAGLREHMRAKYTLMAQAGPEFIWVDDDIRMHFHGGVVNGVRVGEWCCFCPTCLEIFAATIGRTFSREQLVAAFNVPENGDLRRAWVRQNAESLRSLLVELKEAVRAVDPKMVTGLMTAGPGWSSYNGPDFPLWFDALDATKARPGGGFYSDETPGTLYTKALDVGQQRWLCPPTVDDSQYELENFPYQTLKKSIAVLRDECTLSLAFGLNGIAFNALGMTGESEDYQPILDALPAMRPEWEQLVAHACDLPTSGIWPAWTMDFMGKHDVRPGETWPSYVRGGDSWQGRVFGEIGLPLGVDGPGECGSLLLGRMAEAFSDDELRGLLAGGVMMDGDSLDILQRRGLADLAGATIAQRLNNGVTERLTDDPINGVSAGTLRDARIEFWGDAFGMADVLEPGLGTRVLGRAKDYFGNDIGPCMTACENALGGRVVVMGYAPTIFIHSVSKRRQLQNIADWLSRDRLPVRIEQTVRLIPVVRLSSDRTRGAVVLLNAGCDVVDRADIELRVPSETPVRLVAGPDATQLPTRKTPTGPIVTLEKIQPWTTVTLLLGE